MHMGDDQMKLDIQHAMCVTSLKQIPLQLESYATFAHAEGASVGVVVWWSVVLGRFVACSIP